MIKETVTIHDVLCARCLHRHTCRGIGGPVDNGINKCNEFKRDFNVKLVR